MVYHFIVAHGLFIVCALNYITDSSYIRFFTQCLSIESFRPSICMSHDMVLELP